MPIIYTYIQFVFKYYVGKKIISSNKILSHVIETDRGNNTGRN